MPSVRCGPEPVLGLPVALHAPHCHLELSLGGWDDTGVTFKWKDYRLEGPDRYKTMTLAVGELFDGS